MKALKLRSFFLCLGLLLWCSNARAEAEKGMPEELEGVSRSQTLVIGRVTNDPSKHYERLKTMVDYVAGRLKDSGIRQGSILMAKSNEEMIQYLKEGKVDWVSETPFSAIIFSEETGAEMVLRKWKDEAPEYYSVFITRKDSGINSLDDLKGKKIAFEDTGSTTAYFVPTAVLKGEGLQLQELSSPRENSSPDKVGYVFAKDELNISTWVHKGLTEAGAFSNLDWEDSGETPEAFKKDLKIFYQTKPFPRAVELLRKDLDPKIKRRIMEVLLGAHEDPEAKDALKAYDKCTRFDELEGKAKEGLEEARRILERTGCRK